MSLHAPSAILSARHAPSWLLLAFAAGSVNAAAFLACTRFVTHVTGTVSHLGMSADAITVALDLVVVLACFVVGAMAATALVDGRRLTGRRPLYALPLVGVVALLTAVAVLGEAGVFGEFGGSIEGTEDFAFLSILAFAMGVQNAAVATSTGLVVRTTHMTGPATDLGIHLVNAMCTRGAARATAGRHAALRAGKIVAFAAGATVGGALAGATQYLAFLLPAALVAGAMLLSFLDSTLPAGTRTSPENA